MEAEHEPVRAPSLIRCPHCDREMRLLGAEPEDATRELYTFECDLCGHIEVRGVRTV